MSSADLVALVDRLRREPSETEWLEFKKHRYEAQALGEYPNLLIAGQIAKALGYPARHIRERGFNKQYYLDLILALVENHGPVSRVEIDRLLLDKLPEVLTERQKKHKVHNLLSELARQGRIVNTASRNRSKWQVVDMAAN